LLLFFVIFSVGGAVEDTKLNSLRAETAYADVWNPEWDKFKQYVVEGPRNYTVVVFITSESQELQCAVCPQLKEQLSRMSKWYQDAVPRNERDLFIVSAEWSRNREVFQNYHTKIQTMPSVIIIRSTTKKGSQFKFKDQDKIPLYSDISADHMCQYINTQLGVTKILPPEPSKLLQYLMVGTLLVLLLWNVHRNHKSTNFWMCVAMVFPWFTYTGTYFNLNTGPPFIYVNPSDKKMIIIWPSQQMQTILEGFLLATLILSLGICFAMVGTWIPNLPYSRRRIVFWMLIVILSGLLYLFYSLWKVKSPWYLTYS